MRSMYGRDLGNRYSAPDNFYRGTRYVDELIALVGELACKVFRAKHADVRPISGHVANLAVLLSMTKTGDKIVSLSEEDGGYGGISHKGLGSLLSLKNVYFPYDREEVNIDT